MARPRGRPRKAVSREDWARCAEEADALVFASLPRIAQSLIDAAAGGDVAAARYLMDRALGRPREQVAVTGADEGPVEIVLQWQRYPEVNVDDDEPEAD